MKVQKSMYDVLYESLLFLSNNAKSLQNWDHLTKAIRLSARSAQKKNA